MSETTVRFVHDLRKMQLAYLDRLNREWEVARNAGCSDRAARLVDLAQRLEACDAILKGAERRAERGRDKIPILTQALGIVQEAEADFNAGARGDALEAHAAHFQSLIMRFSDVLR